MRLLKLAGRLLIVPVVLAALAGSAALLTGCKHTDADEHPAKHAQQYTCPMHPDVVVNTPGKCPQCGMDLVEKH